MELSKAVEKISPLTIVDDRYNGTYSGGKYTAWNMSCWQIPSAVWGDDVECRNFWWFNADFEQFPVGKGDTPNEAAQNLLVAIKNKYLDIKYQYDEIIKAERESEKNANR